MTTSERCVAEEHLILYYYGETAAPDEDMIELHLQGCASCREQFATLQRVLGAVDESTAAPAELPDGFERTVWARLEPALEPRRRGWLPGLLLSPAPLGLAAAVVLLVTAAFYAGRSLPSRPSGPDAAASRAEVRERVLLLDLSEHLDRSQAVLVEIVSAAPGEPLGLADERDRAGQLLSANRLYRVAATATGDRAVAALLDDLERVLVDVSAGDSGEAALDDVQRRIDARSLLFRVRAAAADVRERQQDMVRDLAEQSS